MHLRPIGRPILLAAGPLATQRVFVESLHTVPRLASISGAKQALRRGSRIPDVVLLGMSRSQPEDMVHHEAFLPFGHFWKGRWGLRLFPGLAEICGPEDRGTKVAGARRREQGSPISRVEHEMVHDVAQKHRLCQLPGSTGAVAAQEERTLAGADEQGHRALSRFERVRCRRDGSPAYCWHNGPPCGQNLFQLAIWASAWRPVPVSRPAWPSGQRRPWP